MKRFILTVLLASSSVFSRSVDDVEYSFTLKNARLLKTMLEKNAWASEFKQTLLFDGLTRRLGLSLYVLGSNENQAWTGRLVDYLYDKILENRPVTITYIHRAGLVSPLGMQTHDFNPAEKAIASALLKSQRIKDDIEVALTENLKVFVTPIVIKHQTFAAVLNDCLTVSRDSKVAALLSQRCGATKKLGSSDAVLEVNLKEHFSGLFGFMKKFYGVSEQFKVFFRWDSASSTLVPDGGSLPLEAKNKIGLSQGLSKVMTMVPSHAVMMNSLSVLSPSQWTPNTLENYFKGKSDQGGTSTITWIHLGMSPAKDDAQILEPRTAFIIPMKKPDDAALANFKDLFNAESRYEVKFRYICQYAMAVTRFEAVLDVLEKSCQSKGASLKHVPKTWTNAVGDDKGVSAAIFFNPGEFLKQSLMLGWNMMKKDPKATKVPQEITSTQELLQKLPRMFWVGKKKDMTMTFERIGNE